MTLNNTVKKQTQNVSNNSNGNLQIKKKIKKGIEEYFFMY